MAAIAPREGRAEGPSALEARIGLDTTGLLAGKYRLDYLIARGGMAAVWHGTHVVLERPVAVKLVDFGAGRDERVVERFLREAKTAALIHHPNVVDIIDFGTASDGQPFMVMELLEGETLLARMGRQPPLTTREVLLVFSQLLLGLEAVHRSGIVHHDLKPANVFLSVDAPGDEPFARLLDFGISYSIDPESELRRGRFGTNAQLIIGTPEYMSPEQAEGRPDLDARTDLYSAAVILYEMLAGALPFQAPYPGAVLFKVIEGSHLPLDQRRPDLAELSDVIERAMSRDLDARPPSAAELRRQVLAVVRGTSDLSALHARLEAVSDPPSRPSNPRLFIPPPPRLPAEVPPAISDDVAAARSSRARSVARERALAFVVLLVILLSVAFWLGTTMARPFRPAPGDRGHTAGPALAAPPQVAATPARASSVAPADRPRPTPASATESSSPPDPPRPAAHPHATPHAPGVVLRQLDF